MLGAPDCIFQRRCGNEPRVDASSRKSLSRLHAANRFIESASILGASAIESIVAQQIERDVGPAAFSVLERCHLTRGVYTECGQKYEKPQSHWKHIA
jgi:hypothetical protein